MPSAWLLLLPFYVLLLVRQEFALAFSVAGAVDNLLGLRRAAAVAARLSERAPPSMEIILLETVERLGQLGDVVRVRPGYARNYLIPQGKARYATEENLAEVRARRDELERRAGETLAVAERAA